MRKLFLFVFAFALLFVSFMPVTQSAESALAVSTISLQTQSAIDRILSDFVEEDASLKTRSGRVPGSDAEKNSAFYIRSKLAALSNFKPVNSASVNNGIESFTFTNIYSGLTERSQNVVFKKESMAKNGKKVVLCAHYDTSFVFNTNTSDLGIYNGLVDDGVSDNAASVAVLLNLAQTLDRMGDLGFDIEVVFFGASTNDHAGARCYNRSISDEDASNILLVVNFDKIAIGKYTYMYVNECKTPQQDYYFKVLDDYDFKALENGHIIDFEIDSPNGLSYSHIGLESDHAIFMERHINTLNFFSGDYEEGMALGNREYLGLDNLTYTRNDNLAYIRENRSDFLDHLASVNNAVLDLLADDNFIFEMQKENGARSWYGFWANKKLAVIITFVLLIVFIVAYYLFYLYLRKKSIDNMKGENVQLIFKGIEDIFDDKK